LLKYQEAPSYLACSYSAADQLTEAKVTAVILFSSQLTALLLFATVQISFQLPALVLLGEQGSIEIAIKAEHRPALGQSDLVTLKKKVFGPRLTCVSTIYYVLYWLL
jgi:hypothetical protein